MNQSLALFFFLIAFVGPTAWPDAPIQWRGSPGWEANSSYCRLYDAHHVETIKGKVLRVEDITPMPGMGYGVYLTLRTPHGDVPVHLGPKEFVKAQPIQFFEGDIVTVTGSRVSCNGKPAFLAAIVKHGNETAKYRELNGRPAWAAKTTPKQ